MNEEGEYEAWKARELRRIARHREEKEREAREAEQHERLKHMTDEERRQWERENPKVRGAFALPWTGKPLTSSQFRIRGPSMRVGKRQGA